MASETTTLAKSHHQRRISAPSWPIISKLALRTNAARRKQSLTSSTTAQADDTDDSKRPCPFLGLPGELIIQISCLLEVQDLFNLRRASVALNAVVTHDDSVVPRFYARHRLEHIPRFLDQGPRDGQNWRHILSMTRRHHLMDGVADLITDFVQYKTLLYHNAQRNLRFAPVAKRIKERLVPMLYTISVYLSQIKAVVLRDLAAGNKSADLEKDLETHTTVMLQDIPPEHLRSLHYTWLFLLWLVNALITRPSYAGSIERTLRGWTADPLDRSSMVRLLIFGNLVALQKILRLRDYKERRKWAQQFLKSLDPAASIRWHSNWANLDVGLDDCPTTEQARKALAVEIPVDWLWVTGSIRILEAAGGEHSLSIREHIPSPTNTTHYLSDLAGYDLFHANVPRDYEEQIVAGGSGRSSSASADDAGSP